MSGPVVYEDDDTACLRTFATLRIYPGDIAPSAITAALGVEPTRVWNKGSAETAVPRTQNGWFLSSRGQLQSLDTKRHVDFIITQLAGADDYIQSLLAAGAQIDLMCLWYGAGKSEGGPSLLPAQMQVLGSLGISIAWNVYIDR